MDESQGSARKKMLTRWLRSRQLQHNDPMKGKRVGRAPGAMKRHEDGSVGSTDKMPHRKWSAPPIKKRWY